MFARAYHACVATIADVAQAAGVSIATVSRVLSPGPRIYPVRPDTAERVRVAAQALNFIPSPLARGLASQRSGLLGLLVPDLADPHYPHIASGVEDSARAAELAVLICNTLGSPERLADYLRLLQARHVDAIVLCGGSTLGPDELATLEASTAPVVLIGRPAEPSRLPFVSIDNLKAARDATMHLLGGGRTRIVHLAGPASQTTMQDRADGYRRAMAEAGLEAVVVQTNGSPEDGLRQAWSLLDRPADQRPDAVFAATDRLALAVLATAADLGLKLPDELAVVGFDDLPLAPYFRPALTSVAQPARLLGDLAIQTALQLTSGLRVEPVVIPAELVVRESSRPARSRGIRRPGRRAPPQASGT
jgi:DNA-binding LacI/PurR family transcriptional regulator